MRDAELRGMWRQIKDQVRSHFSAFSDEDVEQIKGRKDEFLGKIEERYGVNRREALKRFNHFLEGLKAKV